MNHFYSFLINKLIIHNIIFKHIQQIERLEEEDEIIRNIV
jgi:hypothetical protein